MNKHLLFVISLFCLVGCVGSSQGPTTRPSVDTLPYILDLQTRIAAYTVGAVDSFILTADGETDQQERAKAVIDASEKIMKAVDDKVDIKRIVDIIVVSGIDKLPEHSRVAAHFLVTVIRTEIRIALHIDPNKEVIEITKMPETFRMIRKAAEAAKQQAEYRLAHPVG